MVDEVVKPTEEVVSVETPTSESNPEPIIESPVPESTSDIILEVPVIEPEVVVPPAEPISVPAQEPVAVKQEPIQVFEPIIIPESIPASTSVVIPPPPEPVTSPEVPNPEPPLKINPVVSSNPPEILYGASHSVLEPNYSSNPKLNSAALSFISYMSRTKETLALANKKRKEQMMKRVYRVMDLFKKKQKIKNDDVEKFIHTDDSTATKYLNILVKEGKVKREGKPKSAYYIRNE